MMNFCKSKNTFLISLLKNIFLFYSSQNILNFMSQCAIQLLESISNETQNINFSDNIALLKQLNLLNCPNLVDKIWEMSQKLTIMTFVRSCYKLVLYKLLEDLLLSKQEKYQHQYSFYSPKFLQKFAHEINAASKAIKEGYCTILQQINQKKSQVMQLILFVIFFLTRQILFKLCENCDNLRQYFHQKVEENSDQLSILSCLLINYKITGLSVKKNVYIGLRNKYLLKKSQAKKNTTYLMKTNIKLNCAPRSEKIKTTRKQESRQSRDKKFLKEVTSMFQHQGNCMRKSACQSTYNFNNYNSIKDQQVSKFFDSQSGQNFGYSTLRNSYAFSENRNNYMISHSKKPIGSSGMKTNTKHKKSALITQEEEERKRKMGMSLISASLRFLFVKNEKKNAFHEVEKPSLTEWRKKINKMHEETNIQRAKLNRFESKWKNNTKCTEQNRDSEYQRIFQALKNNRNISQDKVQHIKSFRQAFQEELIEKQHRQVGIVRSVVNFIPACSQIKHKRAGSKQFKQQYKEFIKSMADNYSSVVNENNYNYRLQKVLLRNWKS